MKKLFVLILFTFVSFSSFAQAFLQTPIEGEQGKDWIIVNYVDWDPIRIKDHQCGSKTYYGHEGTDFTLRSFRQMDSGVNVLAAAAGIITFVKDGEFDRETGGDFNKRLGNYIAIKHNNDYFSYYGHLKKNSILVNVGDSVKQGEAIGLVGSSGNSTDAHLHFELWYDSSYVVDPFAGTCGNANTLWLSPAKYDTSFGMFESGLISKSDLTINNLRERYTNLKRPYAVVPSSDSSLNFWSHLYGLESGKKLSIKWYRPDNTIWFQSDFDIDRDYWYYYFWSWINHTELPIGFWTVKLEYDGAEIASESFEVSETASIISSTSIKNCSAYQAVPLTELLQDPNLKISITDIQGRELDKKAPVSGLHLITVKRDNEVCVLKKMGSF